MSYKYTKNFLLCLFSFEAIRSESEDERAVIAADCEACRKSRNILMQQKNNSFIVVFILSHIIPKINSFLPFVEPQKLDRRSLTGMQLSLAQLHPELV